MLDSVVRKKPNSQLATFIGRDKVYIEFNNAFNNGDFSSQDFAALQKELMTLHASKTISKVSKKTFLNNVQDNLVEFALQLQALSSRIVTIKVTLYLQAEDLHRHIKDTADYLSVEYADSLKSFTTEKSRQAALMLFFRKPLAEVARANMLIAVADEILKDIERNNWGRKDLVQTFAARHER